MKQLTYYIVVPAVVLAACLFGGCNPGLKINGVAGYRIVVPAKADTIEIRAAQQLRRYLFEMSGTKLPVVEEGKYAGKHAIWLGQTAYAKALNLELAPLKDDGYRYKSQRIHGRASGVLCLEEWAAFAHPAVFVESGSTPGMYRKP
jgi:hypothetical protein